jgi:exodeoxyribonuclease-3
MALHRKYEHLLALRPDVAIISECGNPEVLAKKALNFKPSSSVWIGENPNKGLATFTFGAFRGTLSTSYQDDIPFIAPIEITGPSSFNLLSVWACHSRENSYRKMRGPLMRAIDAYQQLIEGSATVVAGDFNDNVRWDKPTKVNRHRTNVDELGRHGLVSAYHLTRTVEQGDELDPTLYWRDRTREGPSYHIDYCFVPRTWTQSIVSVDVGSYDNWVGAGLSDHVPLIVEISGLV